MGELDIEVRDDAKNQKETTKIKNKVFTRTAITPKNDNTQTHNNTQNMQHITEKYTVEEWFNLSQNSDIVHLTDKFKRKPWAKLLACSKQGFIDLGLDSLDATYLYNALHPKTRSREGKEPHEARTLKKRRLVQFDEKRKKRVLVHDVEIEEETFIFSNREEFQVSFLDMIEKTEGGTIWLLGSYGTGKTNLLKLMREKWCSHMATVHIDTTLDTIHRFP
eukprot:TRINITY_DN272_c0_g1_i8.p2 TRINITY_DN272_c0_g1~~TRINITY_DN272_c0_g1_i8.p2  ORF type:complete len:220 (-),score=43.81 TRINITY_DN272_c0_g1_i8:1441-2100(-)